MKIGILGGTFDPVHHGHLILARDAIEQLKLDHVRFLPAAANPFKQGVAVSPAVVRIAMLGAATRGEPRFVVDGREIERGGVSYAIDSVIELIGEFPKAALFYIVGEDNVATLDKWHRIEELRRLARFIVFNRFAQDGETPHLLLELPRQLDISSTEIRRRVAAGKAIDYFVPPEVADLIQKHRLYRETAEH